MRPLMIGDVAAATGTKVSTVRFYEQIGLLARAARTESGRRTYGQPDVLRLAFIRRGRAMGFSIDEIRSLLELSDRPDGDCAKAAVIARRHLGEVEERIRQLTRLRVELTTLAKSCDGGRAADCSVIGAIAAR
ncbi:MAG: helix-turn-helix domain-containing protein [Xanthobacteraceae bacterium]|nr:helix-turn-helix domain-containing protein [Xanthobacteraceae bacterium]